MCRDRQLLLAFEIPEQRLHVLREVLLAALPHWQHDPMLHGVLRNALIRIEDTLDLPHTYPTRQERRKGQKAA